MEYDHIAFLYSLLRNTQVGMDTIECVHPAGVAAVGELANAIDGFHIVAGGVLAAHAGFLQRHFQHILDGCTGFHFVGLLSNPGVQIAICKGMSLVRIVLIAAKQSECDRNLTDQFIIGSFCISQFLIIGDQFFLILC